jgi:hypothetical protein
MPATTRRTLRFQEGHRWALLLCGRCAVLPRLGLPRNCVLIAARQLGRGAV